MDIYQLGQVLLVDPNASFAEIAAAMERVGLERQDSGTATQPFVEGEPETASWWWHGRKPFVIYTFNPIVKLRVLDVATVPPGMRGAIASQVRIMDRSRIISLFDASDPRDQLLALWGAQESEDLEAIPYADRLANGSDPVVADQARLVVHRLRQINEARYEALASLRILTDAAPALIARLSDPAFTETLKPADDELPGLFDENLTPLLREAVNAIHSGKLKTSKLEPDASIKVFGAAAGMLRWPNMLSEKFPLGYRDIAGWMNPRRIWLAWTVTTASGGTVRYDGLAWLDRRWVWLPKIYRYLVPYLLEDSRE
jgi:hypothetical protein